MITTSYPRHPGDSAGHFVESLAKHLADEQDVHVDVFSPADHGSPTTESQGRINVRRLRYFWPSRWQCLAYGAGIPANLRTKKLALLNVPCLLAAFMLALIRRAGRCDWIHAHWGVLGALALWTKPFHRRPIALTVHGSDLRTQNRVIGTLTKFAIKRCDLVMVPSEDFRDRCCELRNEPQDSPFCQFVPHGINMPPLDRLESDWRDNSTKPKTLISVGRLIPERRHDLLIESIPAIRDAHPDVRLILVGDGPERTALESQADQLGVRDHVEFVGHVPVEAVSDQLMRAGLYVSSTNAETFGLAVAEAAGHAMPIVTTDVGFPGQMVIEDETGHVVETNNAAAIADAVLDVLNDAVRQQNMGFAMRSRLDEMKLTWSASAARVATLYRDCYPTNFK